MRALLFGLFVGYFLIACAPLHWRATHLAAAVVAGLLGILLARCEQQPVVRAIGCSVIGVALAAVLLGNALLQVRLPDAALQRCVEHSVLLRLQVTGLPQRSVGGSRFDARVLDADSGRPACASLRGAKLRMKWRESQWLVPGQVLLAQVRLRQFRGSVSPGAFDYELNALRRGLLLGGYVVRALAVRETDTAQQYFAAQRLALRGFVQHLTLPHGGVLLALMTGDTQLLEANDWQLLQDSGTVHLLIISGLHVGLVTALLFGFVRLGLRGLTLVFPGACSREWLQASFTAALALLYVLFVGAGVPALRAWIMAVIALAAWSLQRRVDPAGLLLFAALGVVAVDGLAPLAPGFWLSFGLVGWLLLGVTSMRTGAPNGLGGWLQHRLWPLLKLHFGCAVMLAPLLGWLGIPVAGVGPLANALAVPFVSLVLVPCVLLSVILRTGSAELAGQLLMFADVLVEWLFIWLYWLVQLVPAVALPVSSPALLIALLVLVVLVLLPAPTLVRLAGVAALTIWMYPWLASGSAAYSKPASAPPVGEFVLHVLDVGQGLAVIVQTRGAIILYDTGASYPSGFNFADAVILPGLQRLGVAGLDALIVSHPDNDHAGGVDVVRRRFPAAQVVQSTADAACRWQNSSTGNSSSRSELLWVSAGVALELLQHTAGNSSNDRSCVLVVRGARSVAVLAGDIEASAEAALLARLPRDVEMLSVPHHGSKTSSTPEFVRALRPHLAVVSAGFANRFGHPHPEVVQRYVAVGSKLITTAEHGTVMWRSAKPAELVSHRRARAHHWQLGAPLAALLAAPALSPPVGESSASVRESESSSRHH